MSAHHPSGYEASTPKMSWIVVVTALTVVSLVGLKFLFDSYFSAQLSQETYRKAETDSLVSMHQMRASHVANTAGIEAVIKRMASGGRVFDPRVAPVASTDMGAAEGWAHQRPAAWELDKLLPTPVTPEAVEAPALEEAETAPPADGDA